jgi:glycosyltransferase involved in cell wall biosynthesis
MKIAVNTRLLLKDKMEGIGWFTYETLKRITASHPEIEFIFIFDRKPSQDFIFSENVQAVVAHPQSRHPILWYLFFEFGVYRVLKKHKPDLFLSPDGWLSLRSNTPQLAVIHDLNFEKHPEFVPFLVRKYYLYFFPRFAKKARRLTTVSEYSKKDIVSRYGVDEDKVDVVYNGVNDVFRVHSD